MFCFEHISVGFLFGLNYVGSVCFGFFGFLSSVRSVGMQVGWELLSNVLTLLIFLPVKWQSWCLSTTFVCTPFPLDSMCTFLYPQLLYSSDDPGLSRA